MKRVKVLFVILLIWFYGVKAQDGIGKIRLGVSGNIENNSCSKVMRFDKYSSYIVDCNQANH